jgi:hypothetical protein
MVPHKKAASNSWCTSHGTGLGPGSLASAVFEQKLTAVSCIFHSLKKTLKNNRSHDNQQLNWALI